MNRRFFTAEGFRPPSGTKHRVRYGFFGRLGGVSSGVYASLNCGHGSADEAEKVAENRRIAAAALGANGLLTAAQEHGGKVAEVVSAAAPFSPPADGLITAERRLALGVLTADCLPILLIAADTDRGLKVATVHGGWRSLAADIIAVAVGKLGSARITALVGPGISAANYEVGDDFVAEIGDLKDCLREDRGRRVFDLRAAAVKLLKRAGVGEIFHCEFCTFADRRFFSRRRALKVGEGDYGRQVAVIFIE